jgi:predicted AAA+ superfamily ATPase
MNGRYIQRVVDRELDEWQRVPQVWDAVRHAVDRGSPPSNFLLTGSASPVATPTAAFSPSK